MVYRPKVVAAFYDADESRFVAIDEDGQCWVREVYRTAEWESHGKPIPIPVLAESAHLKAP